MIMADKIIALRKKSGLSQEELAEMLGVSRQSVSKWEGAQAMPDMGRVLRMSEVFGVTTDLLLKDELEIPEGPVATDARDEQGSARPVSMEEASAYIEQKAWLAPRVAIAVSLIIVSPTVLIALSAIATNTTRFGISQEAAVGVGLIFLMVMVAVAVAMLITGMSRMERFEYIEQEPIDTAYGVGGMARERREGYRQRHTGMVVAGVVLCILAVLPIFATMVFLGDADVYGSMSVCLLLVLVAAGVNLLTRSGIVWGSYQALLEEGDYARAEKAKSGRLGRVAAVYWLAVVAVFLAWSFSSGDWNSTWIVWPVAGVVFAIVMIVANILADRK